MNEYIEQIREHLLKKKPSYQTTNRKEIRVRCPYCGDSKKDMSAAHLYIEMSPPFLFHCFKCETAGFLTQKVLQDLEVYENKVALGLIEANKSVKENQNIQLKTTHFKNLLLEPDLNTLETQNTLNYFNTRFGTNLDPVFISKKFNCVLNPSKFITDNNIFIRAGGFNYSEGIGFLSSDRSHVVFRDIYGRQQKRYNNLNLYQQNNIKSSSKIYNISADLDILKEKVNLVITEGIFDIIGVYLAFYKDTLAENNTIFAAACGKGYNAVILNYIRMGFLDFDLTIYSDNDVDINFFKSLKNISQYLHNSKITIYYNTQEKDFGVPKDRISLKKVII